MRAIAKWLVFALPAAAKLDQRSAAQIEFPAVLIKQLKISFDVNASVALYCDLCGHGLIPVVMRVGRDRLIWI